MIMRAKPMHCVISGLFAVFGAPLFAQETHDIDHEGGKGRSTMQRASMDKLQAVNDSAVPAYLPLDADAKSRDAANVASIKEPERQLEAAGATLVTRIPEVTPLFEQPGVLTPGGKSVLEPAIQFGYSSSNRITVVGYTMIPTIFSPLIDVREVKRSATIASLTARYGITNRLEVEIKVPYVYRSDDTVIRDAAGGVSVDPVFGASGKSIGDIELAARYQFNDGESARPYFVGGVRVKTRTGRDPFEVVTDCAARCDRAANGTGLLRNLPTGSGFYAVEPSLTWLMPSDPAILFGTVSYMHNFKRDNVSRTLLNGVQDPLGEVSPGYSYGFNLGLGLSLNEKTSVSFGYDHKFISRPLQNGEPVPGSVRTQLATLMVGLSYRVSEHRTINVSLGGGLTRDAPDVSLMVRLPVTL